MLCRSLLNCRQIHNLQWRLCLKETFLTSASKKFDFSYYYALLLSVIRFRNIRRDYRLHNPIIYELKFFILLAAFSCSVPLKIGESNSVPAPSPFATIINESLGWSVIPDLTALQIYGESKGGKCTRSFLVKCLVFAWFCRGAQQPLRLFPDP